MSIATLTRRRRLVGTSLLAGAAALTLGVTAPAADASSGPHLVTCHQATIYENYDSGAHAPYKALGEVQEGWHVGFTDGKNPVYNGFWAQVYAYNVNGGVWGVMEYDCFQHG